MAKLCPTCKAMITEKREVNLARKQAADELCDLVHELEVISITFLNIEMGYIQECEHLDKGLLGQEFEALMRKIEEKRKE